MDTNDIHDSEKDKKKLQPDDALLNLPDVNDIPGQENIHVPALHSFEDTTPSSADEEGTGLGLDDNSNVTEREREDLHDSSVSMSSEADMNIKRAELDATDLQDTPLNEGNDIAGDDLDVPGEHQDDANEAIGEEDEENNQYSLGGDKHDSV